MIKAPVKSSLIKENYFSGSEVDWLNQIPEGLVDTVIGMLSLNPSEEMIPEGYSPIKSSPNYYNVKTCLWRDLVKIIHRWGMPSPTELNTSPSNLRKHTSDIRSVLSDALEVMRSLEYEALFEKGTMTKEFMVADRIRQASEVICATAEGRRMFLVSPLIVKQEHHDRGKWGKYYPFDHELEPTISSLEKMVGYVDKVLKDSEKSIAARGKKKKAKDDYDALLWGLCHVYKKYTGKAPVSWNTGTSAINAGQITGAIIPFLQTILPYTFYGYDQSAVALQKKIERIRKSKKFADVWTDSKK